jgi:hypothetical protein
MFYRNSIYKFILSFLIISVREFPKIKLELIFSPNIINFKNNLNTIY